MEDPKSRHRARCPKSAHFKMPREVRGHAYRSHQAYLGSRIVASFEEAEFMIVSASVLGPHYDVLR
jgi:hypothetical protein